jgi:hypothetical protein
MLMISVSENFLVEPEWFLFLSLNNSRFSDFVDRINPIELEIKDTTDTDRSASYLDLHLEIDSEERLRTKHYDKRDDFNFPIYPWSFVTQIFHNGQPSHGGDC